jgi:hypothetical protein
VVDGVDDLAAVDPFEVDAGDAEVRVPHLALNDDQRDALFGNLDCVRVAQLVRSESAKDARGNCQSPQGGPSGRRRPGAARRLRCSHLQASIPTWRRRPPFPRAHPEADPWVAVIFGSLRIAPGRPPRAVVVARERAGGVRILR